MIESTTVPSPAARAVLAMLPDRRALPPWPGRDNVAGWRALRAGSAAAAEPLNEGALDRTRTKARPMRAGPLDAIAVVPRDVRSTARVVYLHGGGYVQHSAASTLFCAAQLAAAVGIEVVSLEYPLAPETRCPGVLAAVLDAYGELARDGRPIVMVGDSAGGGLALAVAQRLVEAGAPTPAALVLGSPWLDLTDTGASRSTLADADVGLSWPDNLARAADAYQPGDKRDPMASPIYGAFGPGFPPTLVQVGTDEVLLSDSVRLASALRDDGTPVELELYEGMPHVFHLLMQAAGAPEATAAYRSIAAFVSRHVP